jgi:hypothetical protein
MKSYKNYVLATSGFLILLGSLVLSVSRTTQGEGGDPGDGDFHSQSAKPYRQGD